VGLEPLSELKLNNADEEVRMPINPLASPFDTQEGDTFALEQPSIDLNRQVATNKYGGALKYSELSPEDQAVVDARRVANVGTTPTTYQGVVGQDYGVGQQYESPEEALGALPSYLGSLEEKRAVTDKEFNRLNYDPSEFVRAGFSPTPGSVSKGAALDSTIDYITKNKIPLSKEVDGQTRYLTTGLGADVFRADEDFDYKAGEYKALGPVGTYSTVHVPPVSPLNDKYLAAIGMFLPPVALATTAMKVITGEKLTPMEIVGATMAGLNYAGVTRPPTGAGAGGMGPVDTGTGLFGTTYNQTQTLARAAAADDLEGGVVQVFAPQVIEGIKGQLPQLNIPETGLPENFEAGLTKTVEKMVGGASFEEAIKAGGIEFIREGGLKPLEGIIKEAVKPLGAIVDPVKETFAALDKNVLQPITKPVGDVLSKADTAVREKLSEIDDSYLQPVGDALSAADTAVRQALPSFGSLGIDLPNISLGMLTGGSMLSPTRTTDNLFKEDLFKLKTEIGISPVEQLLRSPQQQRQQEVAGLYEDPFASSFDKRDTF
jgi:hypothetical protein